MADPPARSGARVLAVIGALLLVALAIVVALVLRAPAPTKQKKAPVAAAPPRVEPAAPRHERPKEIETTPIPTTRTPPVEVPPIGGRDIETTALDVAVFGADGLAAPGATVLLLDPFAQHSGTPRRVEIARKKSDETGHAKFDAASRMTRVYAWRDAEAGATDKFVPSDTRDHVAVRMSAAIQVKGRVVESGGAAVAGAAVRFVARAWFDDSFGVALQTTSDANGQFELPPIPAAAFDSMPVGAAAIDASAKGWPTTTVPVTAEALRAGEIVVRLERGAFVRGRFLRPNGDPVGLEEVRLADGRSVARSGSDGTFELPLPRSGGLVVARAVPMQFDVSDSAGRPAGKTAVTFGFGAAKLLGRFRGDAGDVDLGDVRLAAGQAIKGRVVDLDEKPVKAADVALSLAGVSVAATQTDDDGKFEIDGVGDDPHDLVATEAPGENAWSGRRHASISDVRGGATDLRIVITGALSVVVKFLAMADNSPVVVPEAKIRADAVGATPRAYGWTWAGGGISTVRFEVENAGSYTATVELPGYEPATTEAFDVSAEREIQINVLFRKKP